MSIHALALTDCLLSLLLVLVAVAGPMVAGVIDSLSASFFLLLAAPPAVEVVLPPLPDAAVCWAAEAFTGGEEPPSAVEHAPEETPAVEPPTRSITTELLLASLRERAARDALTVALQPNQRVTNARTVLVAGSLVDVDALTRKEALAHVVTVGASLPLTSKISRGEGRPGLHACQRFLLTHAPSANS